MAVAQRTVTGWTGQLPKSLTIIYELQDAHTHITLSADRDNAGFIIGYRFRCPKCGVTVILTPGSHSITVLNNRLTVKPTVLHKECGWHVMIRNGLAWDE